MSRLSRRRRMGLVGVGVLGVCWLPAQGALAQWALATSDAENQAIAYSTTAPADAVAALQRTLDRGGTVLRFEPHGGYLRSVLQALRIPMESQGLVFSKTSFQRALISPARPRAVYFNHQVYVGWVPGGRVLEIASLDPTLGPIFYTLDQREQAHPRFERQTRACLSCHDSPSVTGGVPGLIMKSVHVDGTGEPLLAAGVHLTSDQSPMGERWGGWYVTGRTGTRSHMGADTAELTARVHTGQYLRPESDPVALTVLAHQTHVQNLLTRVGYRTRMALHFDRQRNAELGRHSDDVAETTRRLIARVAEPLVRAMLFVDEAPLAAPLAGTSAFSTAFADEGPRDAQGRSLFELDLTRRLLRYPCSYLIYSASFDALPEPAKAYVYRRLWEVLRGDDTREAFAHLTPTDRRAILGILQDTREGFAAYAP